MYVISVKQTTSYCNDTGEWVDIPEHEQPYRNLVIQDLFCDESARVYFSDCAVNDATWFTTANDAELAFEAYKKFLTVKDKSYYDWSTLAIRRVEFTTEKNLSL